MAGDWIKMRVGLQTHPKVVRIASATKADRLRTVGGLHAVWGLFDEHSEDGHLVGYTPEALDDMLSWPGFSHAMEGVGWLIVHDESLQLPEFDTHNGQSAKRRAQETDRKREARKTSASDADKKRTREEKRREEKEGGESAPRGTRLPKDWELPQDWRTWAEKERPDLNISLTADTFADHWRGVAGAKGVKLDWEGTWRNWVRRQDPPRSNRGGQVRLAGGFVG